MELLNSYFLREHAYKVRIGFINTTETIKEVEFFLVTDKENKRICYFDNSDYLKDLYRKVITDKSNTTRQNLFLSLSNNEIIDITYVKKIFSCVRILDDTVNPDNNGKVMYFSYGKVILDKIKEYIDQTKNTQIQNVFSLNVTKESHFRVFEDSCFRQTEYIETDYTLNLSDAYGRVVQYQLPLLKNRIEKINKIKERINAKTQPLIL